MATDAYERVCSRVLHFYNISNPLSAEESSDFKIRILPRHLCIVNLEAHEPQIIAIGPINGLRCRNLEEIKEYKMRFLEMLLQRKGEDNHHNVRRYVQAMGDLQTLRCYICIFISYSAGDYFLEMMLFDACFIVEPFRKFKLRQWDSSELVMNKFS